MHELGIVYEIVKIVDEVVKENDIQKVEKIILEVGQLSMAIPRFLEECYPAAVDGTDYEETALEIEILTAKAQCQH
jgi:hydrogenase nickel incorporation protein HypA/HybF